MNEKNLISVIVPIYNVEEYLEECVCSIIKQTYQRIEILLIDDGSTDKSGNLCEKFSKKDNRIKAVHKKNGGLADARNVGVRIARGEYVVFVDSDDVIHPQMIQFLYEGMMNHQADISICSHEKIFNNDKVEFKENKEMIQGEILSGADCIRNMYSPLSVDMVVAWNKLYKKEYLRKNPYPSGKIHEDEFTTYKILMPLNRCLYIPYPLYYYRQRKYSIMQQRFSLKELDLIEACEERKIFLEKSGIKDLYLTALCRYQTVLAEMIIDVAAYFPNEKNLIKELECRFGTSWKKETRKADISFQYKMKYLLFMMNKNLYAYLKKLLKQHKRKNA